MPRSASITGDALQVQKLLAWCRANGHEITRLTVGVCTVDVAPAREAPKPAGKPAKRTERPSIYSMHGGDAFRAATEGGDMDGDLVPAVGRK